MLVSGFGVYAARHFAHANAMTHRAVWLLLASALSGCQDAATAPTGAAGTSQAGGTNPGASGSAAGGTPQGGNVGTGGSSVAAGGLAGTGGTASTQAGAAGSAGGSGGGGASAGPKVSAGCGKPAGPTGERQMAVAARTGLYIVSLPPNYSPDKAYPLGFGFHGRNRNHKNCQEGDCAGFQSVMGGEAVLVYMQSLREPLNNAMGGWEAQNERDDNSKFFENVLAELKANYCIDEQRVFVAGSSSGASFSNLLGCRYGDQLLAVGPVSGALPESQNCKGAPAAIVIHGIDDPHVTFASGVAARTNYATRSTCTDTTLPPIAGMHADIRAKRDAQPSVEDDGCVDYQGCAAASPLRWCEHSFGGYDGSTHGWPPTGGKLIWDFVKAL